MRRQGGTEAFVKEWERYDEMRLARLTVCLRARQPAAMIGYSILVYRLTDAEVDAAVNGTYSQWLEAVASSAAGN